MKLNALLKQIKQLQLWLPNKNKVEDEELMLEPMPVELFSADQMERYGITLAMSHELVYKPVPDKLIKQLNRCETILTKSCQQLTKKGASDGFSPAREWLLDNFYLIQEQIHSIRRNLPKGYGRALPQLAGTEPGYPRIYDIAVQIVEHGDGHWDLDSLMRFMTSYQSVTPLTLGELWATPITLGIALIQNLSKASVRIVADKNDRNLANDWADRMTEVAVSDPKKLVIVIADMARSDPVLSSAFVAELSRRLQGAALALPLSWIEQRVAEEGLSIEYLVQEETKLQAANQVTISNSISGLRHLAGVNWRDFVEKMSVVEKTLKLDPIESYANMDFATRDRYRHVVEKISRASGRKETDVALAALELATNKYKNLLEKNLPNIPVEQLRYAHVGYYLVDDGILALKRAVHIKITLWQKIKNLMNQCAVFCYVGGILFITAIITFLFVNKAYHLGINHFWLWVLGIAIGFAGSQLAVSLVNLMVTFIIKPKSLPKMDFSKGIPKIHSTLVVVPGMLSSISGIDSLIEALEVRYLGNQHKNLYFGLLSDFNDAKVADLPEDQTLLNLAIEGIQQLNQKYAKDKHADEESNIFYLFHRPRVWNETEEIWMGRERKRGKLADLNNLLLNQKNNNFSVIIGDTNKLQNVKYIITLDSDTQLPRECAQQLIGAMVHPLNIPIYDQKKQRVIMGHGILQPRIAEALPTSGLNRYVWLFGNEFGIDPYTRTVSEVYQDLFDEGSFIGKGIYDVKLFQNVLGTCLPNNRILSHDLLEGCYLRSGFISDVSLYEKSPSNYLADVKRKMRWIRGDWQLLAWLFPFVSNGCNRLIRNPLSFLSKYKLFDNLRRSLVPIAFIILFCLILTILPPSLFWFGTLFLIILLPEALNAGLALWYKPDDMLPTQHLMQVYQGISRRAAQIILFLCFLPHEGYYSTIAILKTVWRLFISKCHLLEWVPSDQAEKTIRGKSLEWITNMWIGPVLAVLFTFVLVINQRIMALFYLLPLFTLWFFSPVIAKWISKPYKKHESKLLHSEIRFLHKMARRTWGFFETFVTAADHWLPPDNYQETPIVALARRSSPTNIGLSLLANLTAYDFRYITVTQLLERTKNTVDTLLKLERYRGHLYNWYSTETLQPLIPRYISTVDSGNFAGHLLTLRQGLLALAEEKLLKQYNVRGLEDTLEIISSMLIYTGPLEHFKKLLSMYHNGFNSWTEAVNASDALCSAAVEVNLILSQYKEEKHNNMKKALQDWSYKLLQQCSALSTEILSFSNMEGIEINSTLKDLALRQNNKTAEEKVLLIERLADQLFSLAQVDMGFLYDKASHLMTIGFNVDEQRKDSSNYDLLSSEARLGNFVAIAQGQVPQESWFSLGRLLVSNAGDPILISWSGSMFEYLMPLLVMPTYPGTILDQTCRAAVKRQIAYGKQQNVPWGISESGYNAVDTQYNYLYKAFGVPGLGLKRGLEEDLVIAPYASAMALMVNPKASVSNLQRLAKEYSSGEFGFYEAIDFTKMRLPHESKRSLVRSFMAHHQGMAFLAFSYLLHQQPMQKRFSADPLFQATLLLLQERIPRPSASYLKIPKSPDSRKVFDRPEASMRVFNTPNTRTPQIQLLSNGRYHVMLTQAGGGYSHWKEYALTRWREDSTCDNWGLFSYIRDVETGQFWSTNYQPTTGTAENFKTIFSESHVEFSRSELFLDMHTEVVVSPEDDIELRRLRIHNRSKVKRVIEFTSYAEIVLVPQAADLAQPAFNNLFIETEILEEYNAIIATRRCQDEQQNPPWLCHLLNTYSNKPYSISFETDRSQFIGRGHHVSAPRALLEPGDLSNTAGAVLDPMISIRARITLEPDALVTFDLLTGVSESRSVCVNLIEKYQDRRLTNRIFGLAWTHGQVLLHQLNISEADAQLYGKIASAILYASNSRRANPNIISSNQRGQSALWGYAISGDLPIVLLQIEDAMNIELVRQLLQAQAYWRRKGLIVDLIILNEERVSYRQNLQEQIMSLISATTTSDMAGSIVVRAADQIPIEDQKLFQSVARIIISDKKGTLKEQLSRRPVTPPLMPNLKVNKLQKNSKSYKIPFSPDELYFYNKFGGFSKDGKEYIIRLTDGVATPAPWSNVIANPNFGTLVSESGQGYTWIENAHEFRLTPWENDALQDLGSETFYLRDEETGLFWSPTPLPCRGIGEYQVRHGFGYSIFLHNEEGIYTELTLYVDLNASIKFFVLKVHNQSKRIRRISVTGFVAWVLGEIRSKNALQIVTEMGQNGSILAKNSYNTEFGERTAFFDGVTSSIDLREKTVTGDRMEFIGRNGSLQKPAALLRKKLSGRVGAGYDPCAAVQIIFDLEADHSREIVFTLGAGKNKQEAENIIQTYHGLTAAFNALTAVKQFWQQTLSTIQVTTPDPALNLMANGWLMYQVLSSRLWGRSGYYQSGGAFGFRDQLQDVMAILNTAPNLCRDHILLCAAHQFEAGDVQHWWHPPLNRGVRTRCSDDYLWLPYVICRYIEATGDLGILNEEIPFLKGRPLKEDEESYYDLPIMGSKEEAVTLYQHAIRAIHHGLRFGSHGLPLMGSGDWNDGMNLVGIKGKGESVWLGFFLYDTLRRFAPIALRYGDAQFAESCETECNQLKKQLNENAWDGEWYRRAYFDDGTPLGSTSNTECRIDSIAQSWSVLSTVADKGRAETALASLNKYLVNSKSKIIKLLDPPFDKSKPNPGYIEGYVPGIRENGGQYTHAAIWATMAFAELGEKDLAWQLYQMLNPINHGLTEKDVKLYKIEPYVVAADIYSIAPHVGRGGWSWYTGSAGWFYRLIIETLLGLHIEDGNRLNLKPFLPDDWNDFHVNYRYGNSLYKITIARNSKNKGLWLDDVPIPLSEDKNKVNIKDINIDNNKSNGKVIKYIVTLNDDAKEHNIILNIE